MSISTTGKPSTDDDASLSEASLVALLKARGQPKKKAWWERYLKNELEFYGVPMQEIRSAIVEWKDGSGSAEAVKDQGSLRLSAFRLLRTAMAEPKLAGMLILQEHVFDSLDSARDLPKFATLFHEGHIRDWHITDWLCVKVLGKLVERDGADAVELIRSWVDADTLWQRRASLVTFVNITSDHKDTILDLAHKLSFDEERFAQTAIGWVLRSLSESHAIDVCAFLNKRQDVLSTEAMRMATAKLSDAQRRRLGVTGKRKRR